MDQKWLPSERRSDVFHLLSEGVVPTPGNLANWKKAPPYAQPPSTDLL